MLFSNLDLNSLATRCLSAGLQTEIAVKTYVTTKVFPALPFGDANSVRCGYIQTSVYLAKLY